MGKIVYKNTAAIICLLIALICSGGSSHADMQEAELFEKAYEYYLVSSPEKALEIFDLFLTRYPDSSALDSVLFWRAKSLMQLRRGEEAADSFRKLREVYPESSYALFAEKELQVLNNKPTVRKSETARDKTSTIANAQIADLESRTRILELEKTDLEKQLADVERRRQLTEKGLSKALDDKNALETQLDEARKTRDELIKKEASLEKGAREISKLSEEKRALEAKLTVSEEKVAHLSGELANSEKKNAVITSDLSGKIQQSQQDWGKLDLYIRELKAENTALGTAVKERDKALTDAQQTIMSMKKSAADSQSLKQRNLENVTQSLAQLSAEKVFLEEEVAIEKKKADELLAALRKKDEAIERLLSEEAKLRTSDLTYHDKIKQGVEELASVRAEKEMLQTRIRTLETRDQERNSEIRKFETERNELQKQVQELESRTITAKDTLSKLEDSRKKQEELVKLSSFNEKEIGKLKAEKADLEVRLRDIDKKQSEAERALKRISDERQVAESQLKDQQARLAKSQEAIALLESSLKGSKQETSRQIQELTDRSRAADQDKKTLQEELGREKKLVEELSGKVGEREASLINEVKMLGRSRQELEARLAAEQGVRNSEIRKFETERNELQKQVQELESRTITAKDTLSKLEDSRKQQEELVKLSSFNEKEIGKLKAEKADLVVRLRDAEEKAGDLAALKQREVTAGDEKNRLERMIAEKENQNVKTLETLAQLQNRLKDSEKELAMTTQSAQEQIRLSREEKKNLEEELKKEKALSADLSRQKTENEEAAKKELIALETARREMEQTLIVERGRVSAETKKIASERDELKKQLQTFDSARKEREDLALHLEEIKRLYADAQIKGKQSEDLADDHRVLLDEKKKLEKIVTGHEEKIAALSSRLDNGVAFERERTILAAKLDEQEKRIKDQQSQISSLMTEKGATERELMEAGAALASMKTVKDTGEMHRAEVELLNSQKQQMQAELAELKRLNEQQTTRNADLTGEISTLRAQFLSYEKPFLKIGKEKYSLAAVMRESMTARIVADKIQARNVLWKTGNIVDDFIAEEVLGRKAREDMLSAESSLKESLAKQYALNDAEVAYLDKYLAVERLVKKRLSTPAVKEKDFREYYDKHKEQYILGRENRIRVLSLKYGKTDELEKGIIAVEMHGEALEGRPFETIAKKHSAIATMKEMSLSRLPEWARNKLEGLKQGEISNIISVDNELMIIQPIPSRPAYRSFEEVRKEIEKKFSAEQSEQRQSFDAWLNSLKKDVEFLK
ncbi:MAG: outer membrane protein assembly factor BamD [Nitrospirae bacterium]|nr:outer membrane protein assembly factor BamD [Nitrospirota bacterium]